ncbi:MAG: shikimate kinase [Pyrinomonadaceae bacterium]
MSGDQLLSRRVVITGFMGAGKTTVARVLAARLGCASIDLDEFIAARHAGRTPRQIIDEEGEPRFRALETVALRAALDQRDVRVVIALGGGAWAAEENRQIIDAHGCLTVWLDAPFELCWRRITAAGDTRPLARDADQARSLFEDRRAGYGLASLRVSVEEEDAEKIVTRIVEAIIFSGAERIEEPEGEHDD